MPRNSVPVNLLKNPIHLLSTGFGSGLAPYAPGTFGTIAAIPLYLLAQPLPLGYYLLITFLAFVGGVYVCQKTASALGVHDHSGIVWDEIVGFFITMIGVPFDWMWILTGFVLFRFFDIVKPWPIRWIDTKVSGGVGIMLDDVVAGLFALLGLHSVIHLF